MANLSAETLNLSLETLNLSPEILNLSSEMPNLSPELLSLSVAFEQWANRSQVQEIRNVAVILTQSQKLGNDPSTVLMEFADNMRTNLRQRADAQAQRTTFLALFPTILFMWVPALILLVGPIYFDFAEKRRVNKEALKASDEEMKQLQKTLLSPNIPTAPIMTD